ncbi:hypothetical protein [Streptomyces sp. CB01373]|uniref:hypothetical protein n=1 Tax=Streptomyces sp. CB01373 TaxID=2020325 RepID=UPI001F36A6C9|nr:hypothetical protein [Streptomyces sp. CB01373]
MVTLARCWPGRRRLPGARHEGRGTLGGIPPDASGQVRVSVHRDRNGRMAEALGHDRHVYARGEHERCLTVAQVVKPDAAQAGRVD